MTAIDYGERARRKAAEDGVGPTPWDTLLRALRLLPEDEDLLDAVIDQAVGEVAAFYDPETKEIGVITDSGSEDPRLRMHILSHELTHYLQDRDHDLQKRQGEAVSLDSAMLLGLLIEGEALVNSTRVLWNFTGASPDDLGATNYYNMLEATLLASIYDAPSPLAATVQNLPYLGGRYVARLWDDFGRDAVDELYDDGPATTAEWLTLDGAPLTTEPAERLACAPPHAPEGFELYELDHFGAAGVLAMLTSIDALDLPLARDLTDDAIALYVEQGAQDPVNAKVIGIWRMRFRYPESSERFFALFENRDVGLRRAGSDLLLRVSSDPAHAQWQASELEACPSPEELAPMHADATPPTAALKSLLKHL